MDEVELGAGLTDNAFVFAGRRRFIHQEVLHVHAGPGAFEDDRAVHESQYACDPRYPKLRIFTELRR